MSKLKQYVVNLIWTFFKLTVENVRIASEQQIMELELWDKMNLDILMSWFTYIFGRLDERNIEIIADL